MPDLTALVGSRICHDLISPLGAIGNGMELLEMAPGVTGRAELALISDSVARANGRIRLFRLAFGAAGDGIEIAGHEASAILSGYYEGSRIEIAATWPPALPRSRAKAALLAVLCAESALLRGGRITLDCTGGEVHVTAEGPRVEPDPRLWSPLEDGARHGKDLQASEVQFALLPPAVAAMGRRITVTPGEGSISLSF